MADDEIVPEPITEPIPEVETEVEQTLEEIGQELLERLDAIDARLSELENRFNGYSAIDHSHEQSVPPPTRPDEQPRPDHIWFRRVGE